MRRKLEVLLTICLVAGAVSGINKASVIEAAQVQDMGVEESDRADAVIPEGYTPISDIYDLYAIRNNPEGNYILVNDIDMSATQKGGDFDCGTGWDSIE